jgi:hypothetical protein
MGQALSTKTPLCPLEIILNAWEQSGHRQLFCFADTARKAKLTKQRYSPIAKIPRLIRGGGSYKPQGLIVGLRELGNAAWIYNPTAR